MSRTYTLWTDERTEALRRGYAKADSLATLAGELGCSVKAIHSKAFALGLRRRSATFRPQLYTKEQFELVRRHYPDMSNKTLSVVSGVSPGAIRKWQQMFGWRKSDRYREECKEYTSSRKGTSERRRALQREYARRYREKYPERVAESKRKYREKA